MVPCKDCPYYYPEYDSEGNAIDLPHCQYPYDDGYAPCEVDDSYETPDTDDENMEDC